MTIKLRPYQQEANDAVFESWKTYDSVLVAMATGTGKTETFLSILARLFENGAQRALIIAHREELIFQPRDRIGDHWLENLPPAGIVMGSKHNDAAASIVVSTVQTLYGRRDDGTLMYDEKGSPVLDSRGRQRRKPSPIRRFKRLRKILENGRFDVVITDETHHATAASYQAVYRVLRATCPGIKHLGVTATPKRSDGNGLVDVFDHVAYRLGIKEAIKEIGCLVPFKGLAFTLPVSFKGVRIQGGDYASGAVGEVMSAKNARQIIVEKWLTHGEDRPTMCFTATVKQAQLLAQEFVAAGVPATYASGTTKKEDRRRIVTDYQAGKYKVLVNCALWTEGLDIPKISCVIMARPTRSDLVYIQSVGRGLRLHPSKADCLVLDFAPLDARDLVMAGDLLGMPREQKKALGKAEDDGLLLAGFTMNKEGDGIDANPDQVLVSQLDYFGTSPLRWTFDGVVASAPIKKDVSVAVVMPQDDRIAKAEELKATGQWDTAWDEALARVSGYVAYVIKHGSITDIGRIEESWESAVEYAEDIYNDEGGNALSKKDARWRSLPPSDKSVAFARRLGIEVENGMNAGHVSQQIGHRLTVIKLKKARYLK